VLSAARQSWLAWLQSGVRWPDRAGGCGFLLFDAADKAVEFIAGGFGEGVEESFEAVAAKGAGEKRMESEGHRD